MHECPNCGQACGCDGDDLWQPAPRDCQCDCWQEEGDEYDRDYDDEPDGCVLGDKCCCPHPYHRSDECCTAEDMGAAMRDGGDET